MTMTPRARTIPPINEAPSKPDGTQGVGFVDVSPGPSEEVTSDAVVVTTGVGVAVTDVALLPGGTTTEVLGLTVEVGSTVTEEVIVVIGLGVSVVSFSAVPLFCAISVVNASEGDDVLTDPVVVGL